MKKISLRKANHVQSFCLLLAGLVFVTLFAGSSTVSANHGSFNPEPGAGAMPGYIRSGLLSCDAGGPASAAWISPTGSPSVTSTRVSFNQASVNLTWWDNGRTCAGSSTWSVPYWASRIDSVTAYYIDPTDPARDPATNRVYVTGVNGLVGTVATLHFNPSNQANSYTSYARNFTFSPPSGILTESRTYYISARGRSTNHFQNGSRNVYRCIEPPGVEILTTSLYDFSPCSTDEITYPIEINVDDPVGVVDASATCNIINGWSFDQNDLNASLDVHIYIDGVGFNSTSSNPRVNNRVPRPDVNAFFGFPPGTSNLHGFEFIVPAQFLDGASHTVQVYAINIGPGNTTLVRDFVLSPCISASCGNLNFDPLGPPGAGQQFNISVSFNVTSLVPINYRVTFNRGALQYSGVNPVTGLVNGSSTIVANFNNVRAPAAGEYTGSFVLEGDHPGGVIIPRTCEFGDANGNGTFEWQDPIAVVDRPYYKIYGGDAAVGSSFEGQNGSCQVNTANNPRFIGFNAGFANGINNGYAGAGTQLASIALGQITDHVSAASRPAVPQSPNGLSLANTAGTGTYGGQLSSSHVADCAPNYFDNNAPANATGPLNMNSNAPQRINGDVVIPASSLGRGADVTIYVSGNVFIDGDITYANSGAYDDPKDIPRFMLVARGNIYVHPRVAALNGIFMAQPQLNSGSPVANTGLFVTCGYNRGVSHLNRLPTDVELNQASPAGCRGKLTTTGAVLAQQVKTLRTNGNLVSQEPVSNNPRVRMAYTYYGPGSLASNSNCVNINESADAHTAQWVDNYLCGSSDNNDLQLSYTPGGFPAFPVPPQNSYWFDPAFRTRTIGGKYCLLITEPAEPDNASQGSPFGFMDSGWYNNYVCMNPAYGPGGAYGDRQWRLVIRGPSAGVGDSWDEQAGKTCVALPEPGDPWYWGDNAICFFEQAPTPPAVPAATRAAAEARGSANIAEVFIYSPEVWLRGIPGTGGLNSFTSLPPVL